MKSINKTLSYLVLGAVLSVVVPNAMASTLYEGIKEGTVEATVLGDNSTAIGDNSHADGESSTAVGVGANAATDLSFAVGYNAGATGRRVLP